jgi:hypothetical protein
LASGSRELAVAGAFLVRGTKPASTKQNQDSIFLVNRDVTIIDGDANDALCDVHAYCSAESVLRFNLGSKAATLGFRV